MPTCSRRIPGLVGPRAMCTAMGATKTELAALEEEGLLIPRTRVAKVKNPWQFRDGLAFVGDLAANATPAAEQTRSGRPGSARKRTQVSLVDLIAAIRDARLIVGQRVGVAGFHGLVLRMTDVDALPVAPQSQGARQRRRSGDDERRPVRRSVGLRDEGASSPWSKRGMSRPCRWSIRRQDAPSTTSAPKTWRPFTCAS